MTKLGRAGRRYKNSTTVPPHFPFEPENRHSSG
jgi:hypothetical protein